VNLSRLSTEIKGNPRQSVSESSGVRSFLRGTIFKKFCL